MALTQKNFRWRNDDGSETAATWKAAADTNITLPINQLGPPVRLRINVITDAATAPTLTAQLMYSKNGGAWTTSNASSAVVVSTASVFVANAAATTEQLSVKAGANWRAGEIDSNNGLASFYFGANGIINDESESEFCFTLQSADLAVGDTVDLRIESGTGTVSAWTVTPRVTISASSGASVGRIVTSASFPLRHAGMGPFKASNGEIYVASRFGTGATGNMVFYRSTDPINSAFDQPISNKLMSSAAGTAIEAAACYQVGDVVHVVTQIATGAVYYNSYNMATDAWTLTTSETAVAAASVAPTTNYTFVSIVVRSNGNVVIAYCAGQTAMSSTFNMVRYRERTGTNTYGTATNVDNGGSVNYSNGVAVLGASDRVHFFVHDLTNIAAHQRTLSAANALQTWPTSVTGGQSTTHIWQYGVNYGGTNIATPVYSSTGTRERVARFTSADTPTVSMQTVSDVIPYSLSNVQGVIALAVDGSTLHFLYSDSTTQDLWHDSDGGTGTWGTDVNEFAGTINRISANVYDRSGTKLAMVVDDGGTIKYAEISLAAAVTTSYPHEPNPVFQHILNLR